MICMRPRTSPLLLSSLVLGACAHSPAQTTLDQNPVKETPAMATPTAPDTDGQGTSPVNPKLTAEQALNVIRNRAQLPNIDSKFTGTKEAFMEAIINERAVELAFESHRFFDLRRWNISGEMKYRQKTALDFDRDANGKPINMTERVVVTRVFEKKHNWLPFQVSYTKLYPEFQQNPGW
jgi:anionic cell wall polymer biosynthesis LytR-Cps2A-Psr (LCP) family protein